MSVSNAGELDREIRQFAERVELVMAGFSSRIVGQSYMGQRLLMALIADGHVLLEGLPGLAKTLAIKTMSELTGLKFSRIQFTPDLLPADVTGDDQVPIRTLGQLL